MVKELGLGSRGLESGIECMHLCMSTNKYIAWFIPVSSVEMPRSQNHLETFLHSTPLPS